MSTPARKSKGSTERMGAYRRRMRERGFRQKTVWVPDLSNPEVLARYHRAGAAIAAGDAASDDIDAFIEAAQAELLKDEPPYGWGEK